MRKNNIIGNIMLKFTLLLLYLSTAVSLSCNKEEDKPTVTPVFNRYQTDLTVDSKILGQTVKYAVYLPESYKTDTTKNYGVIYLLHGYGCDHNDWNDQYLNISSLIDEKENSGEIAEYIYVMPQGFNSYYVNKYDGTFNYMDMFADEFVPFIDKKYRTKNDRKFRAVVGFSMGGYGAMIIPSKHPELFSISVPLSMSFRTDEQYIAEPSDGWDQQWGAIFGGYGKKGEDRLTDYYKEHCPFYFINENTAGEFRDIDFYIDCGDDEEQLLIGNDQLHRQLRNLGIGHEYRVRNGAHTSAYWRGAMQEVLPFIDSRFKSKDYTNDESIEITDNYPGDFERAQIGDVPVLIFKSKGYQQTDSCTAIYFIHDGFSEAEIFTAMNLLNVQNMNSKFVVVSVDYANVKANFKTFSEAIKSTFLTVKNIGIGINSGGKILFESSVSYQPPFSSLFLFDADLGDSVQNPAPGTYYYIDITDMGDNYQDAGTLYLQCKRNDIGFDYRVRNGINNTESVLIGISQAKSKILERTIN